jgi:hypothetical protein
MLVLEDFCNIRGEAESILFGVEKSGATRVLETAVNLLTEESRILVGKKGQPPRLRKHLSTVAKAFASLKHRERLPQSIRGLWKADLFVGSIGSEQWVATTLKTNRRDLQSAPGLRIGLYPEERRGEGPRKDSDLIMCPLPYSGDFMQLFGATFQIVKQLIAANGEQPSRVALIYEDDQIVAKWVSDRRHFPVLAILAALEPVKQPGLLASETPTEEPAEGVEAAAPIPLGTVSALPDQSPSSSSERSRVGSRFIASQRAGGSPFRNTAKAMPARAAAIRAADRRWAQRLRKRT